MGIKNFSKTFAAIKALKNYKELSNKIIAIDAMTELYRAALGAKNVKELTDANGRPTIHIKTLLAVIIEMHQNNVDQIWVFDHSQEHDTDFHNPMKLGELQKRKKRKEMAIEQIKSLSDLPSEDPLFSDDETQVVSDKPEEVKDKEVKDKEVKDKEVKDKELKDKEVKDKEVKDKIASLEKQMFSVSKDMINDLKIILTLLNIKYIEAPYGFEGESIASYLTEIDRAHAVFSGDTDPLAYGAKMLYRRNPRDKLIYLYTIDSVLSQISDANSRYQNPSMDDFLKAAVILGTDACEKTPGIGPMTVLKKMHTVKLTDQQTSAIQEFKKRPNIDDILVHNINKQQFIEADIPQLTEWLVNEKSFSSTRVKDMFEKALKPSAVKTKQHSKNIKKQKKEPDHCEITELDD